MTETMTIEGVITAAITGTAGTDTKHYTTGKMRSIGESIGEGSRVEATIKRFTENSSATMMLSTGPPTGTTKGITSGTITGEMARTSGDIERPTTDRLDGAGDARSDGGQVIFPQDRERSVGSDRSR